VFNCSVSMVKKLRLKGCELYHHIYNRGNDRHPIFKNPSDYKRYLKYLKEYSKAYGIDIIAYALMEWHIHLFILDHRGTISEFMERLHGRYAIVFNRCYGRVGHVFGSRFKNSIVDADNYAIWLSRYIHRQAVEAGLVEKPEDYEWTSYQSYVSNVTKSLLKPEIVLSQFKNASDDSYIAYEEFVNCNDDGPINWREAEQGSRSIIGNRSYIEEVNTKLGMINVPESSIEEALSYVCFCLSISIDELKYPKGKDQRILRHKAVVILSQEYSLGVRKIARALNMSPSTVSQVLSSTIG